MLNTWEFFLLYFASFGVHYVPGRVLPKGAAKPEPPRSEANVWNTIPGWVSKAADAVGVFKNEGEDRDERVEESHVYCYLMEEYMRFFVFKSFEEDLANSKVPLTFLNNDYYTSVSSEYGILSSSMLEILLECFLHITNLESPTEYAIPTDLVIEGLTITLKALLRGMRSIRTLEYGPPTIAHSVRSKTGGFYKTTQEELFQALFQKSVCKRLFLFLTRAFGYAYWSATTLRLLRYVVEIWIMVLRPWGLSAPSWMPPAPVAPSSQNNAGSGSHSTENANLGSFVTGISGVTKKIGRQFTNIMRSSRNEVSDESTHSEPRVSAAIEQARRDFVVRNLVLYGPTLVEFLHMAQRFNMTHKKELKIIIFGFEGWNNQDILEIVMDIENCMKRTLDARRDSVSIPQNVILVAEDAFESLKNIDQNIQIHHLRGSFTADIAQRLVSRMRVHLQSENPMPVTRLLQEGIHMCREIFGLSDKVSPVAFDLRDGGSPGSPGSDDDGQPARLSMRRTGRAGKVRDVKFLGKNKYRPIASYENPFLTRRAFELSQLLKKKTGVELDLRLLGAYKIYVWLIVLALFMLIFIGFIALIQSDFGPYEDYYTQYDYEYDYEEALRQNVRRGARY